ncbi:MAG: TIGR03984 family CRISPR-associated protein [Clostridiales bacterium]|nr:TIGR03984 family CRISPR-associated protein [Clostridiales bacterium]
MNGLKKGSIASKTEIFQLDINNWLTLCDHLSDYFINKCTIVAYLRYKVLIGEFTDGLLKFFKGETFDPKFLIRLRAFNDQRELLIWADDKEGFYARLRMDGTGEEEWSFVDADQVLWGKPKNTDGGWLYLKELRGPEFYLPYDLKERKTNVVKIRTRNYIGYNELGQAGYIDCRFVRFCGGGN